MSDEALRLLERLGKATAELLLWIQPSPSQVVEAEIETADEVLAEARAFLAGDILAARDAEKAVLVEKARAYLERGLHLMGCNGFPHTNEPCDCGFQALKDALADTSPAAAALLARVEREREALLVALAERERLREALGQPGPNIEGCACERDGDEDSPLCPMHVSKFGVLRKETLSFLLVDYEAQFEAIRAALAPGDDVRD